MKLISSSHPKCRSIIFTSILGLFFCFLLFSYIAYYIDYAYSNQNKLNTIDYFEIILWLIGGCLVLGPVILYFLGEMLWQVKGEEIIQYDAKGLYIVNKGRIIDKTKKIPWSNIKDIRIVELSEYEQLIVHFSVSGQIEERIQILRYKGRKIRCGVNLSDEECEKVLNAVQEMMAH